MQNIDINTCEKFHYNRSSNDGALGNRKSDNNNPNNNKNNVRSAMETRFRVQKDKTKIKRWINL